jgi:hypothetical protein
MLPRFLAKQIDHRIGGVFLLVVEISNPAAFFPANAPVRIATINADEIVK